MFNLQTLYYSCYIKVVRLTVLNPLGHAIVSILIGLIIRSYFFAPTYYAAGPEPVIIEQLSNIDDSVIVPQSSHSVRVNDISTQDINPVPRVAVNPTHGLHQISSRAAGLAAEQALLSSNPPAVISSAQAAILSPTPEQAAIISTESTIDTATTSSTSSTTANISSTPEQPAQTPSIWKTLLIRVKNLFAWLVSLFWGTTADSDSTSKPDISSNTIENLDLTLEKTKKIMKDFVACLTHTGMSSEDMIKESLKHVSETIPAELWNHSSMALDGNPLMKYLQEIENMLKTFTRLNTNGPLMCRYRAAVEVQNYMYKNNLVFERDKDQILDLYYITLRRISNADNDD